MRKRRRNTNPASQMAHKRWASKTAAEKREHALKMVRAKAEKKRQKQALKDDEHEITE